MQYSTVQNKMLSDQNLETALYTINVITLVFCNEIEVE